jgi:hypothetical protein
VLLAGQDAPRLYCSATDRDGDFDGAVPDPVVVAEAWDTWRAEADFATRFVAAAPSLDLTADDPQNQHGSGGGALSLREALVGMIEEYARHLGTSTCCATGSTAASASGPTSARVARPGPRPPGYPAAADAAPADQIGRPGEGAPPTPSAE